MAADLAVCKSMRHLPGFLVFVMAVLPGTWGAGAAATPLETVVAGVVVDSLTSHSIPNTSVRIDGSGPSCLTGADGSFLFRAIPPGLHRITARHVAYATSVRWIRVEADPTAALRIRLVPHELLLEQMEVHADRVVPLTSGDASRMTIPRNVLTRLIVDDAVEAVALMPGVVVRGDRPYFRGAAYDQVLPLVDGVSAREPIRGEWILPPPEAIGAIELTGGSFEAEYGQAVAGILSVQVPDGGDAHRYRAAVMTDRLDLIGGSSTSADRIDLAASGPVAARSLFYSIAAQARLSDTHLAYAHAQPDQRLFGIPLGKRMEGKESAIARLTWAPPARPWKANLTLLHAEERRRPFHEHYSRTGWVGWSGFYDRYTTYIADPADADSAVMNDAPSHVTVREKGSDLVIATMTGLFSNAADGRVHLRLARHRYRARPSAIRPGDLASIQDWLRNATTRSNHQEEPFYATHGDYPDLEDGESREAEIGTNAGVRLGDTHRIGMGGGGTLGSHRFLGVLPGASSPYGLLDGWMRTVDAYLYAQDTWYSDGLSSMTIGVRWDHRAISRLPSSISASTVSPRLSFRQPMTDLDMLHVQVGLLYQFPALQEQFLWMTPGRTSGAPKLRAQRTRAFEVGFQHHFSRGLVGYLGAYAREYSEVIFAWGEAGERDAIYRSASSTVPQAMESYGITLVADHQFHPAVCGQARVEFGRSTREDIQTPWSRAAQAGGWLFLRPAGPVDLSLSWIWDSGAPYDVCLKPKGCVESQRYRGRLPDLFETDLSARITLRGKETARRAGIVIEVRNLFDRRVPAFDFGVASAQVGVANFIAYYDRTGEAGGYILDLGDHVRSVPIRNPETRTSGRTLRLGLQVETF